MEIIIIVVASGDRHHVYPQFC